MSDQGRMGQSPLGNYEELLGSQTVNLKYPPAYPLAYSLAPSVSGGTGLPSIATIYFSHFRRLRAVVDAARSGNPILIKLALAHHDRLGSNDEPEAAA